MLLITALPDWRSRMSAPAPRFTAELGKPLARATLLDAAERAIGAKGASAERDQQKRKSPASSDVARTCCNRIESLSENTIRVPAATWRSSSGAA